MRNWKRCEETEWERNTSFNDSNQRKAGSAQRATLLLILSCLLPATRFALSADVPAVSSPTLTILHPLEGAKLPNLSQVFAYGATVPGSTLTINGALIPVYRTGGYLAMVTLSSGDFVLNAEAITPQGETLRTERRINVAGPWTPPLSSKKLTIDKPSVAPVTDQLLAPGDILTVSFQGSAGGQAEFGIEGGFKHIPMLETTSTTTLKTIYQGQYVVQPGDKAEKRAIDVTLKKKTEFVRAKSVGKVTIENSSAPRVGLITEDGVAARTGPEGGYDFFLYKGMKVALTGRIAGQWRARLSATQSGWIRESAVQELPRGTAIPSSILSSIATTHMTESTVVRLSLTDTLPYRIEQSLDPMQLIVTLYGAVSKADFIRYDPSDPVVRQVRWRQLTPDTVQVTIDLKLTKWWGYDARYEPAGLMLEIREPWNASDLRGMPIAVDAGHGGSDKGAMGPRGLLEKEANLQIAKTLMDTLTKAGAKPFLTREQDIDVPLYERPRIAWRAGARLFISVHCNSSGLSENPIWNNGSSVYWYQPQSQALAEAVHAGYRKHVGMLADRGLFYADFAVTRMTQMPAVLTENAYIIVPDQEEKLFDPEFQQHFANAIVNGIKNYLAKP